VKERRLKENESKTESKGETERNIRDGWKEE
jgi:hypothetical protein